MLCIWCNNPQYHIWYLVQRVWHSGTAPVWMMRVLIILTAPMWIAASAIVDVHAVVVLVIELLTQMLNLGTEFIVVVS